MRRLWYNTGIVASCTTGLFVQPRKRVMVMKIKAVLSVGMLAAVLAATGCSSILRGTHEKIEIVSSPERALCRIYRESTGYLKSVATPDAVYIPRAAEPIKVVCKKAGYETATVVAAPVKTSDVLGNAAGIAGGSLVFGTGVVIDLANSAHLDLPDSIVVEMKKIQ